MAIPKGKTRRNITLPDEVWAYLDARLDKQIRDNYWRRQTDTVSCIIERAVRADMEVYQAFGDKK